MQRHETEVARRIAFYIYSLDNGGAERVSSIVANSLSNSGVEVTIFVMKPLGENSYKLGDKIRVVNLSTDPALQNAGTGVLFNLKRIRVLRRLVKEFAPQVLYTMMVKANVIGVFAMMKSGVPVVASERNDPSHDAVSAPWRMLRKLSYSLSDGVITQTPHVEKWVRRNTKASNVTTIPNPVEYPVPNGSPIVAVPSQRGPMIVAVGRLCAQKQFDHLIATISKLKQDYPGWWLAILGEGADRDSLSAQIADEGLQDEVSLIGRVGNMQDWYNAASMFVLTSRYEGYPNALIEAMASGVPAVSYDCESGPSEIIRDGVNGYLVNVNDTKQLEQKMRSIMSDAGVGAGLSSRAIEIRESLHPDVILEKWLYVAKLVLKQGG